MIGFEFTTNLLLLWRGSRNGFGAGTFHRLCDGTAKTLTVIKSTTGYIFGAYTSVAWASPSTAAYKSDSKAFLFTLTNPANMPLKLKIKAGQEHHAVVHGSGYGPIFGDGNDLGIEDQSNTNTKSRVRSSSYDAPNGQTGNAAGIFYHGGSNEYFTTVDIEVYEVA